tara:strand:+ start:882 stop:1541 length:660 start_codon:yes stop_codon:yes gene_type:complete
MPLRFRTFINEKLRLAPKRKQDKSQYAGVEPGSKGWKKGKVAIGINGYSQSGRTLLHKKGTDLHFHKHGDKIVGASDPDNPNTYFKADANRIKEDVELNEMSAKQHYKKVMRGGRGKGFVVSSPIDRDRYPNKEKQGLEGPYKSRKSGKIFYYDKKAGKYYDTDSDMYLAVNDVMEANEKIKVKLDPKKKIGYTIHNVGPGGKKTLVKSRDMPNQKDVG